MSSHGLSFASTLRTIPVQRHIHLQKSRKAPVRRGCADARAAASGDIPAEQIGLLIECDGVLVDVHRDGHRVAFNRAFAQVGLDCAHWEPAVYHDLLRYGDGSPEALLSNYFNTVGWPTFVPTKEYKVFVDKLHSLKKEAFKRMVEAAALPPRPGAEQLVQHALDAGARVGIIAGTCSSAEEGVAHALLKAMDESLASQVKVFSSAEDVKAPSQADDAPAKPTFEQSMAARTAQMKKGQALNVMRAISRNPNMGATHLAVDSSLMAGARTGGSLMSPTWLSACSAILGVPSSGMVMVAALNSTTQAARGAGFTVLAVPPARSRRGSFAGVHASFDGFGPGGGLTWPRVLSTMKTQSQR